MCCLTSPARRDFTFCAFRFSRWLNPIDWLVIFPSLIGYKLARRCLQILIYFPLLVLLAFTRAITNGESCRKRVVVAHVYAVISSDINVISRSPDCHITEKQIESVMRLNWCAPQSMFSFQLRQRSKLFSFQKFFLVCVLSPHCATKNKIVLGTGYLQFDDTDRDEYLGFDDNQLMMFLLRTDIDSCSEFSVTTNFPPTSISLSLRRLHRSKPYREIVFLLCCS